MCFIGLDKNWLGPVLPKLRLSNCKQKGDNMKTVEKTITLEHLRKDVCDNFVVIVSVTELSHVS